MNLEFNKNEDKMKLLVSDIKYKKNEIILGGGKEKLEKINKKGKLTARQRIEYLVDNKDEIIVLEDLLDEVTSLRRKALISFSANDFRDDSGAECFLLLSNSLSQKINSKLTRQKICKEIMIVGDQLKEK